MIAKDKSVRHYQRGDTIIEVLISIAIAGSVLSFMYSIMNRNLLLTRDAQERTEASKIAQGQIELFKSYRDSGSVYTGTFCLSPSSTTAVTGFAASTPSATLPDNFSNYPTSDPDPLKRCVNGLYYYGIVAGTGSDDGTYRFYVRWTKGDGKGQDQVIMVYRR